MKHKVYLRDWYFNAGIVGFLRVITDDAVELKDSPDLHIGENFIEFNDVVLENFEEKFIRYCFIELFNPQFLIYKLDNELKEIERNKEKFKVKKSLETLNKFPFKGFLNIITETEINENIDIETYQNYLSESRKKIDMTPLKLNEILEIKKSGKEFILDYFIPLKLKGITSTGNIKTYFQTILLDETKKIKNNELCLSCQNKKATQEINNSISNIIGFNKDNSNWLWGYQSNKSKVCDLCALIYNSALLAFSSISKKVDKDYLNYFYALNYNTGVHELYQKNREFKLIVEMNQSEHKPFFVMVKQTVATIRQQHLKNIQENIHFIEIEESKILGGQSTKGYNVFNYSIDPDISVFLFPYLDKNKLPKGFYKIKDSFINLDEELLKLVITRQLSYHHLSKYMYYWLNAEKKSFSLSPLINFILNYKLQTKGGKVKSDVSIKKGFSNGKELREKLKEKKKENQIDGLVYQLLNDLKIEDRERFMDKYIRTMMSHQMSLRFSQEEMLDTDSFLQFGYSFINGLLYEKYQDNKKEGE